MKKIFIFLILFLFSCNKNISDKEYLKNIKNEITEIEKLKKENKEFYEKEKEIKEKIKSKQKEIKEEKEKFLKNYLKQNNLPESSKAEDIIHLKDFEIIFNKLAYYDDYIIDLDRELAKIE